MALAQDKLLALDADEERIAEYRQKARLLVMHYGDDIEERRLFLDMLGLL